MEDYLIVVNRVRAAPGSLAASARRTAPHDRRESSWAHGFPGCPRQAADGGDAMVGI